MSEDTESAVPRRFANATVLRGLFKASNTAKNETSTISGTFGDRVKTQVEVGNLHPRAFRIAAAVERTFGKDAVKGQELLDHLQFYLEIVQEDARNRGHVGNLDDMARAAPTDGEDHHAGDGDAGDPDLNAAPTGDGGVPLGDALSQFEATKAIVESRPKAREKLDLPADGSAGKKGRGKKAKPEEPAAEAAPPPPPPALKDDEEFEQDIRSPELKAKETERRAREEAPGTFAQVH